MCFAELCGLVMRSAQVVVIHQFLSISDTGIKDTQQAMSAASPDVAMNAILTAAAYGEAGAHGGIVDGCTWPGPACWRALAPGRRRRAGEHTKPTHSGL